MRAHVPITAPIRLFSICCVRAAVETLVPADSVRGIVDDLERTAVRPRMVTANYRLCKRNLCEDYNKRHVNDEGTVAARPRKRGKGQTYVQLDKEAASAELKTMMRDVKYWTRPGSHAHPTCLLHYLMPRNHTRARRLSRDRPTHVNLSVHAHVRTHGC
jgi:hypothetical protein